MIKALLDEISRVICCPCSWYEDPSSCRYFVIIGGQDDPDCMVVEVPQAMVTRLKGGWRQDELRLIEACRVAAESYWSGLTKFE